MSDTPETVICQYHLKPRSDREMLRLLARHWPLLQRAGLVTDEPPRVLRRLPSAEAQGGKREGGTLLVEIFTWRNAASAAQAHQRPEIMALWEAMGALCESLEFPHFEPLAIDFAA